MRIVLIQLRKTVQSKKQLNLEKLLQSDMIILYKSIKNHCIMKCQIMKRGRRKKVRQIHTHIYKK